MPLLTEASAATVLAKDPRDDMDITGEETALRFIRNLDAIRMAARMDGPFIYKVLADGIERLI